MKPTHKKDIKNRFETHVMKMCVLGAIVLFLLGLGFRVAPLLDHGERMLWQWPTEDGYLMKTIARNIALGNGMTVSDAEIATNGTQPLTTYLWAGVFWLVDGDKETGVLLIQVLQIVISIVAAGLLFLLARRLLSEHQWGEGAASLGAGLWFASPVVINRTMNGLETGNYMVMILLTLLVWLAGELAAKRPFPGFALRVGALLGLCFLTRIDAVFFIAAVTAWHTLLGFRQQFAEFKRRLSESLVMGLTSMVLASPWLAYNKLVFGSFMPISGTAQSASRFGANLAHVPGNLFEYVTLVLPVPNVILTSPAAVAMSALAILLYAAVTVGMARHMSTQQFSVLMIGAIFLLGLAGYYGLFFGASHFMGRYLSPVSPLLAILTVAIGMVAIHKWGSKLALIRWSSAMIPIIIVGLVLGLNSRTYLNKGRGSAIEHIQVKQWVEKNVAPEIWVGAIQTGVLGFFHDRTVNLDGKVNPHALAAKTNDQILHYIVDSPIQYLADWGIAGWIVHDPLNQHFEVVVDDPEQNLGVLRRVTPVPPHATLRWAGLGTF